MSSCLSWAASACSCKLRSKAIARAPRADDCRRSDAACSATLAAAATAAQGEPTPCNALAAALCPRRFEGDCDPAAARANSATRSRQRQEPLRLSWGTRCLLLILQLLQLLSQLRMTEHQQRASQGSQQFQQHHQRGLRDSRRSRHRQPPQLGAAAEPQRDELFCAASRGLTRLSRPAGRCTRAAGEANVCCSSGHRPQQNL